MSSYSVKGKFFFLLYLLFLFSSACSLGDTNSILPQSDGENDDSDTTKRVVAIPPQDLLLKLEELVRNLSEITAKLESRLSELPRNSKNHVSEDLSLSLIERDGFDRSDRASDEEELEGGIRVGERGKAVSVTKYSPFWSERFQFVSAVKLESDATCINVLPFRDYEGHSKYIAVGDDKGRVYVFLRNGDVLVEFYTSSKSPVTAMVSYLSVFKNESFVVTGHNNGDIVLHKLWEGSNVDEWHSLSMETVAKFALPDNAEDRLAITILEVHHVGRIRYVLSTDVSGKIRVFRENGTLYGSAKPLSRPLAFLKQRLLFLTETGAGSLDLRTMRVRESECEGLNLSLARSYVFDAAERSKAYGFTSDGDLIHVLLLGDVMNFKCRVRTKRKVDFEGPVAFQALKGYLLLVTEEKIFVYNVSSQHYIRAGGPRPLFSAALDEIRSSFLNYQVRDKTMRRRVLPLVASDREKLIVLGLGGGYVGMYRSKLPVFKAESTSMLWTSPVLFFILFLFGAWHFFAKKKEALTSWGPDDPFTNASATTGAPLSGTSDRSFVESSSRSSDIMDNRGGGTLRDPSRRYGSPTNYPGGSTGSYRLGSGERGPVPSSVDPNF